MPTTPFKPNNLINCDPFTGQPLEAVRKDRYTYKLIDPATDRVIFDQLSSAQVEYVLSGKYQPTTPV